MPEQDRTTEEWDEYCQTDVLIMIKAMQAFWKLVTDWDLGNFAYTAAGQAFAAYRHRFMNTPIFIDDNEQAAEISRAGYVGARTECFRLGEIKEHVTCLDINSQYPFIMSTTEVPIKLVSTVNHASLAELRDWLTRFCVVATVQITTSKPYFPKKIPGWTIFPVGSFQTVLNTPELLLAQEMGCISSIQKVAVYEKAIIFKEYVDFFYSERAKAKAAGDETLSTLCKLMMNSLYGKFGQNGLVFDKKYEVTNDAIKSWTEWDADRQTLHKYRQFAGVVEELQRDAESRNSFPAIAGHITSAARVLLLNAINKAGARNVFYVDTDSLFVNDRGLGNLNSFIDNDKLGALKVEWDTNDLTLFGVKDYQRDNKLKRKGVKEKALLQADGGWKQDQFRGFKGMIQDGDLDHFLVRPVVKHLHRIYSKGTVDAEGFVHPLVFPLQESLREGL